MLIEAIETIGLAEYPNLLFVQVHTSDGRIGIGDTFFVARAVEAADTMLSLRRCSASR